MRLLLLTALLLPAQNIRVATRLVEINVIARSATAPLSTLSEADFRVFDNGKERKIAFFALNSPNNTPKIAALPPGIYSNRPESTGATVVLLDSLNTNLTDQAYARRQFLGFLKQLRPADRVAVYALGARLRVLNDFTSDASALLASVSRYTGDTLPQARDSAPDPNATGRPEFDKWLNEADAVLAEQSIKDRIARTVAALQAIAGRIGRLPGRKSLVWITGSFPFTIGQKGAGETTEWNDIVSQPQTTARARRPISTPSKDSGGDEPGAYDIYGKELPGSRPGREQFLAFDQDVRRATRALNDADVAVYPVDARGLLTTATRNAATIPPVGLHALQVMADATGGRAFYNTNDLHGAIRAAVDDAEVTYTLAFYPNPNTLDDRFHNLKVQVKRKAVDLRYRKGYLAATAAPPLAQRDADLRDALASPLDSDAIALAAKLDGRILTVSIEPTDLQSGELEVLISQRSPDGRDLASTRNQTTVTLDPANTLMISKTIDLLPAATSLRLVIADRRSPKLGSLTIPLP